MDYNNLELTYLPPATTPHYFAHDEPEFAGVITIQNLSDRSEFTLSYTFLSREENLTTSQLTIFDDALYMLTPTIIRILNQYKYKQPQEMISAFLSIGAQIR